MHTFLLLAALATVPASGVESSSSPLSVKVTGEHVVFAADVHDQPSVLDPAQSVPLQGLKATVFWKDLASGQITIATVYADTQGRVPIPTGKQAVTVLVSGPVSLEVSCKRQMEFPPGSGTTTVVSPTWTVDLSVVPPVYTPDTVSGGIASVELEAYLHVHRAVVAFEALTSTSNAGLVVRFLNLGHPVYNNPVYNDAAKEIWVYYGSGSGSVEEAIWARSRTTMSHETAHHFLQGIYGSTMQWPPLDRMNEGMADFLASVVAGTPVIGAGCKGPGTYLRTLDNQAQYTLNPDPDPHVGGLVIGGALYHTRKGCQQKGPASLLHFDAGLDQLFAARPDEENAALLAALQSDDDDADLSNGTPHTPQFHTGFHLRHGVPWPLAPVPPNAPPGGLNGVGSTGQIGCSQDLGLFGGPALGKAVILVRTEGSPKPRPIGCVTLDDSGCGSFRLPRPGHTLPHGATFEAWVVEAPGTPARRMGLDSLQDATAR